MFLSLMQPPRSSTKCFRTTLLQHHADDANKSEIFFLAKSVDTHKAIMMATE